MVFLPLAGFLHTAARALLEVAPGVFLGSSVPSHDERADSLARVSDH